MFKRTLFQWVAGVLLIGGLIGWPITAHAVEPEATTLGEGQAEQGDERDAPDASQCAVLVDMVENDRGDQVPEETDLGCFATFAEAVAAATAGAVELPADATPEAEGLEEALAPAQTVILSTEYDCRNCIVLPFFCRAITFFGRDGICRSGRFYRTNLTGFWNNRASSTRGSTACPRNCGFQGFNQAGFGVCFFHSSRSCGNYPGIFNNTISSKRWSR